MVGGGGAGLYAALSKLGSVAFFGAGPVASVMFPYVSRNHSKGKPYKKFFYFSVAIVLVHIAIIVLIIIHPKSALLLRPYTWASF